VKADNSLARQPEILDFLSQYFGPYPFTSAGGIVDDSDDVFFALETQTRPNYSKLFFHDQQEGDAVVVHEDAHQWFGDSLTVRRWRNIWLNEGFATYAEWMWSEHEGLGTAQENFDGWYGIPKRSKFWRVVIGNPGPRRLFHIAVYERGAMALHQLRLKIGDQAFFETLQTWAEDHEGGLVTIPRFKRLAESISGKNLDHLFEIWLYTPEKPTLPKGQLRSTGTAATLSASVRKQLVNARTG
jgi:aminopeptidase N